MRRLAILLLLFLGAASAPEEKRFLVPGFERVRIDGPFDVEIVRGPTRAAAEGEPRLLERLDVHVDGNTLVVGAGPEGWKLGAGEAATSARIRLSAPGLRAVVVNGGGRVRIDDMRGQRVDLGLNGGGSIQVAAIAADQLGVTLVGSGQMTLAGAAQRARIRTSGAGSIDASKLMAGEAMLVSESAGELRIGVRYSVQVNALGLGRIQILGAPECWIGGTGPVECAGKVRRR